MATQTELVARIEVATVKLEQDVIELGTYNSQIQEKTNSAIAVEVGKAATSATQAKQSATDAKAQADAIKAINPVSDAPKTGSTYGRKDGAWVLVEGSGEGGKGTVVSVNDIGPDEAGNVTLPIPKKTSELANDSDFATVANIPTKTSQLTNDKAFITIEDVPAGIADAPSDGKQYARKDAAWSVVEAGGAGGGAGGYTLPNPTSQFEFKWSEAATELGYSSGKNSWTNANAATLNSWVKDGKDPITTNPWKAIDIRCLYIKYSSYEGNKDILKTVCEFKEGYDVETSAVDVYAITTTGLANVLDNKGNALELKMQMLPGKWYFDNIPALPSGSHGLNKAAGKKGVLTVVEVNGYGRALTLETFGNSPTANSQTYVWDNGQATWVPMRAF